MKARWWFEKRVDHQVQILITEEVYASSPQYQALFRQGWKLQGLL